MQNIRISRSEKDISDLIIGGIVYNWQKVPVQVAICLTCAIFSIVVQKIGKDQVYVNIVDY
jgi:hypothetical protein